MFRGDVMFRGYDLRQRIVIDVNTAERLGTISDVEIGESDGAIRQIIIRRRGGFFVRAFGFGEISVPWSAITAVGREFVLVNSLVFGENYLKNK